MHIAHTSRVFGSAVVLFALLTAGCRGDAPADDPETTPAAADEQPRLMSKAAPDVPSAFWISIACAG